MMKRMKKILACILSFVTAFVYTQAPKKFFTRFGGYGHDIGYGVIQTLNGQYAVTGSTGSFGNGNTDAYNELIFRLPLTEKVNHNLTSSLNGVQPLITSPVSASFSNWSTAEPYDSIEETYYYPIGFDKNNRKKNYVQIVDKEK